EVHLDADDAVALAVLAAAALDVEAVAARPVAADARRRELREEVADLAERAGVGRGIAPRRAPDRRLVDHDHLVEVVQSRDLLELARPLLRSVEMPEE